MPARSPNMSKKGVDQIQTSSQLPQPEVAKSTAAEREDYVKLRSTSIPYAGRLGGNQEFVLDPSDPDNQSLLDKNPDAAPYIPLRSLLSLDGFKQPSLWKLAMMEGIGTMALVYISINLGLSPSLNVQPLPVPSTAAGIFSTSAFIGPTVGAITNILTVSLFVFTFGAVTGGHLNSMITIATFFCRLTTFPRMVLYVGFQTAGAVLAGLLVRASLNSTDFKVGGCFFDPNQVEAGQMFTAEFTASLVVIFLAFGVGLDPRQASTFGPALAPILVGVTVGLCAYATSFSIPGYGGAGLSPNRCLAVWVGSGHALGVTGLSAEFGYDGSNGDRLWVYWIGPIAGGLVHAIFYLLVPPWSLTGVGSLEINVDSSRKADSKAHV